jgi:hypothetical protein
VTETFFYFVYCTGVKGEGDRHRTCDVIREVMQECSNEEVDIRRNCQTIAS